MTSCNYRLLLDIYNAIVDLGDISAKLEDLDLSLKIDELDVDLDALTEQVTISNKLKLLELVGTDVMTEEEQLAAYIAIKTKLFPQTINADQIIPPDPMEEEEGEW